jgi:hypothetical protein
VPDKEYVAAAGPVIVTDALVLKIHPLVLAPVWLLPATAEGWPDIFAVQVTTLVDAVAVQKPTVPTVLVLRFIAAASAAAAEVAPAAPDHVAPDVFVTVMSGKK